MTNKLKILSAQRLARTIASDILLYNSEKVERGIKEDNLFELLESELNEGRELYRSRVSQELADTYRFLDRALVDILIVSQAELACSIW